jgi:uncharacterized protein (DUF1499 family)
MVSSAVSGAIADYLEEQKMSHARGRPYHPMTQGKIERWHRVSSQSPPTDNEHFISAMPYAIDEQLLRQTILDVLNETPRTKIVTASNDYIHAESTTSLLCFTDDFELYIDYREKLLHGRSASRVGRSVFGTNRKRVETFKETLVRKLTELSTGANRIR